MLNHWFIAILQDLTYPRIEIMRAFIALPVDQQTTQVLSQQVDQLRQTDWGQQIIWFPPENYHLTLHFLGGKLDADKVKAVAQSMPLWFSEGMSHFEAEILAIRPFPSATHPHSLVASLDSTLLLQYLVREIESQLKAFGLHTSKQAFRPHISLGRIPKQLEADRIQIPDELKHLQDLWLTVDHLTLYESQLTDAAPVYKALQHKWLERYDDGVINPS